ncbi:MAG: hypothetical protein ACK5N8_02845 [Alphaproteobacteria bacterium]
MTNQTEEYIATTEQTEAVHHDGHHYEHFYDNPAFWVGLSFILVVAVLAKPLSKIISGMMKKKIQSIKDQIAEVKQLEVDAQNLLKEYENKVSKIETETAKIIEKSNNEIEYIKKASLEKLNEEIKQRHSDAEQMIHASSSQAEKEISNYLSEKTIQTVKKAIIESLSGKNQEKLIDKSIEYLTSLKK